MLKRHWSALAPVSETILRKDMARTIPTEIANYLELREGGRLFWKKDIGSAKKGQEATAKHNAGYLCVGFRGEVYLAHRVVFLLANGWCPKMVDHIDGNKRNNDPSNLRPACKSLNGLNRRKKSKNSSGRLGVFWSKRRSAWRAEITVRGEKKSLGMFPCLNDAIAARVRAEREALAMLSEGSK